MFPTVPSLGANLASQPFKRSQLGFSMEKQSNTGTMSHSQNKNTENMVAQCPAQTGFSEALGEDIRVKLTTRALKHQEAWWCRQLYRNTRLDLLGWEGMRIRLLVRQAKEEQASRESTQEAVRAHRFLCGTRRGRKTARKNAEEEVRKEARRDADKVKQAQRPTLSIASDTRVKAAAALGLSSRLPSAKETIMYLQSRKREMDRVLRH
ncbi:hypothetical protein BD779DRAFT_1468103 [Infundibulicybe gibba]|nr:hypothetical protein BD779DRAFT_1468103 [Infundibulicybe gibba]